MYYLNKSYFWVGTHYYGRYMGCKAYFCRNHNTNTACHVDGNECVVQRAICLIYYIYIYTLYIIFPLVLLPSVCNNNNNNNMEIFLGHPCTRRRRRRWRKEMKRKRHEIGVRGGRKARSHVVSLETTTLYYNRSHFRANNHGRYM